MHIIAVEHQHGFAFVSELRKQLHRSFPAEEMTQGADEIPCRGCIVVIPDSAPSPVSGFRILAPPVLAAQQGQDSVLFFLGHSMLRSMAGM
jgi:hypothetical protein